MLLRLNPHSGVPVYLQLMEKIKHAIETGALKPGDQLPTIRGLAEELVTNPNTVARAYRELEHEQVIELRQGAGAFVSSRYQPTTSAGDVSKAVAKVRHTVEALSEMGFSPGEMRRLFESELAALEASAPLEPKARK
jgi:GntR family transcriptional regulator